MKMPHPSHVGFGVDKVTLWLFLRALRYRALSIIASPNTILASVGVVKTELEAMTHRCPYARRRAHRRTAPALCSWSALASTWCLLPARLLLAAWSCAWWLGTATFWQAKLALRHRSLDRTCRHQRTRSWVERSS